MLSVVLCVVCCVLCVVLCCVVCVCVCVCVCVVVLSFARQRRNTCGLCSRVVVLYFDSAGGKELG